MTKELKEKIMNHLAEAEFEMFNFMDETANHDYEEIVAESHHAHHCPVDLHTGIPCPASHMAGNHPRSESRQPLVVDGVGG